MSGVSDFKLAVRVRWICGAVAASSESLLDRLDMVQVQRGRPSSRRIAQPRARDQFCSGQGLGCRLEASSPIAQIDAQEHFPTGFSSLSLDLLECRRIGNLTRRDFNVRGTTGFQKFSHRPICDPFSIGNKRGNRDARNQRVSTPIRIACLGDKDRIGDGCSRAPDCEIQILPKTNRQPNDDSL